MKVLLTGGAGYIGSHVNKLLHSRGIETVVLDNLQYGHAGAVRWGRLVEADLLDYEALDSVFAGAGFEAVLHFAAYIFVGESVSDPEKYYRNNLSGGLNLLRAMRAHSVDKLIFSSTAAVYGVPSRVPIPEEHPVAPINPYGWSKLALERMIADYSRAYGWRSIIFRYFNAAGADPEGEIGENHDPENHLVPLLLKATLDPGRSLTVYGTDYDTPDGTCIRDYIHVMDLADAHWLGLERVTGGQAGNKPCEVYNIGNGSGFSVRQVIDSAVRVTGRTPQIVYGPRRPGDAPALVAESRLLKEELGWRPRYQELDTIIADAWRWEKTL
ncbi:MAG: UDP-glucose 4-epimerase GalE, partial [Candidatus Glassbacteria bacterium]|nr:UDP-glucose 4-epimerase GalE [Candidatus Glassbacteria bacterium]